MSKPMSDFIPIDEFIASWKAATGESDEVWAERVAQVRRDLQNGTLRMEVRDITDEMLFTKTGS